MRVIPESDLNTNLGKIENSEKGEAVLVLTISNRMLSSGNTRSFNNILTPTLFKFFMIMSFPLWESGFERDQRD